MLEIRYLVNFTRKYDRLMENQAIANGCDNHILLSGFAATSLSVQLPMNMRIVFFYFFVGFPYSQWLAIAKKRLMALYMALYFYE